MKVTLVPALLLIGFWFLLQVFSQLGSIVVAAIGGVAYMAHIGGFIYGAIAGRFFEIHHALRNRGLADELNDQG